MLAPDDSGIVQEGVEALRWAVSLHERIQEHVPPMAAEARLRMQALLDAEREGRDDLLVAFVPDEACYRQHYEFSRRELDGLARRLESASEAQWRSGDAARFFSGVELSVLTSWEHPGQVEAFGGYLRLGREEVRQRTSQIGALRRWLAAYLERAPD